MKDPECSPAGLPGSRAGQEKRPSGASDGGGDSELSNRFESLSTWRCVAALGAGRPCIPGPDQVGGDWARVHTGQPRSGKKPTCRRTSHSGVWFCLHWPKCTSQPGRGQGSREGIAARGGWQGGGRLERAVRMGLCRKVEPGKRVLGTGESTHAGCVASDPCPPRTARTEAASRWQSLREVTRKGLAQSLSF